MDSFLKEFFPKVYRRMLEDKDISNYCKFDSQLLTTFTSSMYTSGLITTFFASSFTEKFGRRLSMLFGGATFVTGSAIGGAAVNLFMVLLARVLLGVALGFSTQVRTQSLIFDKKKKWLKYFPFFYMRILLKVIDTLKLNQNIVFFI